MSAAHSPGIFLSVRRCWHDERALHGFWPAARSLAIHIWEFLRESTPAQRRLRYGDEAYDWDFRVDTTRANLAWRERLLGHFYCAYQATEPAHFTEMMASLQIDFPAFTFIDVGSGKGRVLMMASDHPFRRILGIELLPALHRVAEENLSAYKSSSQRCFKVESRLGDAREFVFPAEPTVLYLFHPLTETAFSEVIASLNRSLSENPRPVYVVYQNPLLETILLHGRSFQKIAGNHQHSIFRHLP